MSNFRKTVCVDLDGLLAVYNGWQGMDHIGEPIEGCREFLKELRKISRVLIHTTRTNLKPFSNGATDGTYQFEREDGTTVGDLVDKIVKWLQSNNLEFDEVYCGQGKPLAAAYVDDRAVVCTPQKSENPRAEFDKALESVRKLL